MCRVQIHSSNSSKHHSPPTCHLLLSKLHHAAASGSIEHTLDLLSRCSSDIDRAGGDDDWTPLMFAAGKGYLRVIRILLKFGASVSASK